MNILNFDSYIYRCVVFKLTNHCNLACDYCYRGSNKIFDSDIMPHETIERVIASLIDINLKRGQREFPLYLLWHGGEPLLAGIPYFEKILEMEKRFSQTFGIKILNGIQTNATAVNKKWAEFIKNNNIAIGVSIDGHKESHDVHRRAKTGNSSFELTLNGVKRLKEAGNKVSAIAVINNETSYMADSIYDFFAKAGFSMVDFIPCFDHGKEMTLSHEKYLNFMKKIIEKHFTNKSPSFSIRLINDIVLLLSGKIKRETSLSCELAGRCGELFSVLTNGDVYPCECLNCLEEMKIGNINEESFHGMIRGYKYTEFKVLAKNISPKCLKCEFSNICRAGCFNRRILQKETSGPIDYYCEVRKEIMTYISSFILK